MHCHLFLALTHKALGNDKEAKAAWAKTRAAPPTPALWAHLL